MSFPPNPPSSTAAGPDKYQSGRQGRPQQSVWGRPSSNAGTRQGLPPIATSDLNSSTAFNSRRPAPSESPASQANITSPLASNFSTALNSTARLNNGRHPSSASSSGPPQSLFQAGGPQQSIQSGQGVSSPRSRTVTPLSQLVATASAQSSTQGGAGGGGGTRSGTYSPPRSSTGVGSPTGFSFDKTGSLPSGSRSAGGGSSSLASISVAQVSILIDTISEKEGKAKWESKAEQIRKVQDPQRNQQDHDC